MVIPNREEAEQAERARQGGDAKRQKLGGDSVMSLEQVLAKRREENKKPKVLFVARESRDKNAEKEAQKAKDENKKRMEEYSKRRKDFLLQEEIERERERQRERDEREKERKRREEERQREREEREKERNQKRAEQDKMLQVSSLAELNMLKITEPERRERQAEKELEVIKRHYLGMKEAKKKMQKPSEKFRNIFNFEWNADDDTMRGDNNPLYTKRVEPQLLFGRGYRAGIDVREQRKSNSFYEELIAKRAETMGDDVSTFVQPSKEPLGFRQRDVLEIQTEEEKIHWSEKPLGDMTDRDWRILKEDFEIAVRGGRVPKPLRVWAESPLPWELLEGIHQAGYTRPTPIQMQGIPIACQNRDMIGIAETGSGKTAAYMLPMLSYVKTLPPLTDETAVDGPYAIALAPSRELCVQIEEEAKKFAKFIPTLRVVSVVGGRNAEQQAFDLRQGVELCIATPGRLCDSLEKQHTVLNQCNYVVLDEADRMLDMGFHEDVLMIAGRLQQKRQVLFFSATWSHVVQQLALGLCSPGSKPVRISYGQGCSDKGGYDVEAAKHKARTGIVQEVVVIDTVSGPDRWEQQEQQKNKKMYAHLNSVLAASDEHKVLVFVSRKDLADKVSAQLKEKGFKADAMHGGKSQVYRLWVLDQFRQGALRLLVCTDVLGRGIDIPSVSHVVIHEMGEMEDYIHRIGRTARGRYGKGHALVFFEFWEGSPQVARDLIDVLTASKQHVPKELQKIADEVASGRRQARGKSNEWTGKPSRHTAAWSGW
eukprot:gnl/MRDRNA2_/MRDRNA2_29028_c0_seq1.p1 gnl/MRDRNA2_/MRDRNA2_29028_c0~~gnl/MRDRNA2_/MRDRNA2_29028_c0_seq1.p1  ORF type:complete len:768 (+),score=192.48 gnl/MRDRNA2_/MRDRNA2_29028_c0_seq1:123-2426(+)